MAGRALLRRSTIVSLCGLASAIGLLTPSGSPEQRLAMALLASGAAGLLACELVLPAIDPDEAWDALDALALAGCLAVLGLVAITGALAALPGPLPRSWLGFALIATIGGLSVAVASRPSRPIHLSRTALSHGVALLAVAGALRLVDLGFSEYQGDEASILHRASAIVQGVDAAFLAHRKGPGEILVATFFGHLTGRVTESDARFPFALVSVLGVVGVYCAGRTLFGQWAGLVAGLLWAINGYAVAFGRIVQYHSVVVLLVSVALLCVWRASIQVEGRGALRRTGLGLLGLAVLFGFNAITLGLPTMLIAARSFTRHLRHRSWSGRAHGLRRSDALLLLPFLAVVLFVVFDWRDIRPYLAWRFGEGQPFNNLDLFASVSARYLGLPYLAVVVSFAVLALVWLAFKSQPSRLRGAILAGLPVAGVVALLATYGEPTWLAILVWAVLVAPLLLPSKLEWSWRALGLGMLLPLGMYAFLLEEAGTHWYEAFMAMTLLAGAIVSALILRLERPSRLAISIIGIAAATVLAVYPTFTFLSVWPAGVSLPAAWLYQPAWRAERAGGSFGLPHQDGLKALALIHSLRYLPEPYQSNATPEVMRWYLPYAEQCSNPRGSYVTLFSERRPPQNLPGLDSWVITVRGVPRATVKDQTATPRPLSGLANEAPSTWFDEQHARLDRPLSVSNSLCPRPMPPAWELN